MNFIVLIIKQCMQCEPLDLKLQICKNIYYFDYQLSTLCHYSFKVDDLISVMRENSRSYKNEVVKWVQVSLSL